jgi:hypothetical protein
MLESNERLYVGEENSTGKHSRENSGSDHNNNNNNNNSDGENSENNKRFSIKSPGASMKSQSVSQKSTLSEKEQRDTFVCSPRNFLPHSTKAAEGIVKRKLSDALAYGMINPSSADSYDLNSGSNDSLSNDNSFKDGGYDLSCLSSQEAQERR